MRVLKTVLAAVFFMFLVNDAMAKSFTDNGNGAVTDNDTGLVWQQGEGGSMIWEAALVYCEGLSLGGRGDWRLPNHKELQSLADYSRVNPALDAIYFPDVFSSFYWSATTYVSFPSLALAWIVNFDDGYVSDYHKPNNYYVRCVRGGQ